MFSATIVGRLGRDPETRTVGDRVVCNVSIACDYGYGDKKSTTWVRAAFWGKRGETLAKHFSKGDPIEVRGEVYTREHDGKTYVELAGDNWSFVPKARDGGGAGATDYGREEKPAAAAEYDDGVPF